MESRFFRQRSDIQGGLAKDLTSTMFLVVYVMVAIFLVLPHNPKKSEQDDARARGNIRVEIIWPPEMNVDIDLWVKAPGLTPIGYSNMNGPIYNLVRDDLGTTADITGINYETAFSRGLPPGRHTVNVYFFSNSDNVAEVPVKVFVTMRKDDSENSKTPPQDIIRTQLTLTRVAEEVTVIDFELNDDGELIVDSINNAYRPLAPLISDMPN